MLLYYPTNLCGVWVVVSVNTAKMSPTQGMLSVDIALGKVEKRDSCMDLKRSACSVTTQSALAGLSPVTAPFLERLCVWGRVVQTDAGSKDVQCFTSFALHCWSARKNSYKNTNNSKKTQNQNTKKRQHDHFAPRCFGFFNSHKWPLLSKKHSLPGDILGLIH